jgi:hypothetical protein
VKLEKNASDIYEILLQIYAHLSQHECHNHISIRHYIIKVVGKALLNELRSKQNLCVLKAKTFA